MRASRLVHLALALVMSASLAGCKRDRDPGFEVDPDLLQFWRPLDAKYRAVFRRAQRMLVTGDFDGLADHFTDEALRDKQTQVEPIAIRSWRPPGPIQFRYHKGPATLVQGGWVHPITFPVDWDADPFHDRTWVLTFHTLRWLNNRLASAEKGNQTAALEVFRVVQDWLLANASWPPTHGPFAWSDHSTAARLRVLHRTLRVYLGSEIVDPFFARQLLAGILAHLALIATTERYQAWHNHSVIFDTVLLEVLPELPGLKDRSELQHLAARRALEQFRYAFNQEGVHKEHSPCYHHFVSGLMRKALELIEKNGLSVPAWSRRLLGNTVRFGGAVLKPDGTLPNIGDCPDHERPRHPGTAHPGGGLVFPRSGWAIFRTANTDDPRDSVYAAIQSDFNSYVHYQEDDTSFVLHAFGHDLVIDTGLLSYNRTARDFYMRAARAHNVLRVDAQDFTFDLANTGRSGITRHTPELVELTHAHYARLHVWVHRQFGPVADNAFLVRDEIAALGPHRYDQIYHLAPGAKVTRHGPEVLVASWEAHPVRLWLKGTWERFEVIEGSDDPVQGWYFPRPGVSVSQPALVLTRTGRLEEFSTLMAVSRGDRAPEWVVLQASADERVRELLERPRRRLEWLPGPRKVRFEGHGKL